MLLHYVLQCSSLQACLNPLNLVPDVVSCESSKEMVAITAGKLLFEVVVGKGILQSKEVGPA